MSLTENEQRDLESFLTNIGDGDLKDVVVVFNHPESSSEGVCIGMVKLRDVFSDMTNAMIFLGKVLHEPIMSYDEFRVLCQRQDVNEILNQEVNEFKIGNIVQNQVYVQFFTD